jgi:carbonic anhydrase/acetyltransferase-like protein (isoleucine patch superfamily)
LILSFEGIQPRIGRNVFIAPTAVVIGKVQIGDNSSIWYGTVIRGDRDTITIGAGTNIQDNCTIHTDPGQPADIGDNVSIGHHAVVHGCVVEDDCLIGIGAVVLNGAVVKAGSIVGSGAVVKEKQQVGPYHLVAGVPAGLKKKLPPGIIKKIAGTSQTYRQLAAKHLLLHPGTHNHGRG